MAVALAGSRFPDERARVVLAGFVGVATTVVVAWFLPWQLAVLAGWDAMAAMLLVWIWLSVGRLDSAETERVATAEDNTRQGARLLLVGAAVASLVGVALVFLKAREASGGMAVALTLTGVATVVLSWALVHTVFALRYAHLYYSDEVGGIDFKSDAAPEFADFAYVSFTIGMTFQVSDTDVQSRQIRRTVLRHALLAYVFGVVIIAVTINVIAGFVK